jgi:hypothetical protein
MLAMDVFTQNAFSAIELTMAVDRMAYTPSTLTAIPGLIVPVPVRTEQIFIEERGFAPALIQTSPRGAPPSQVSGDKRDARSYKTKRLARGSRITASELQGIRAFGSETELKSLQIELGRRMMKIKQDFALTKENWVLAMIQGKVLDADGTLIYDWAVEFNQTRPAQVAFNFPGAALGAIRQACNTIKRTVLRNLQGLGGPGVRVLCACGDQFWDQLVTSPEVRQTYLNWAAAADLRNTIGNVFGEIFIFGDIGFFNYRGTDDNSTVAIPTAEAIFFPINAGIFQWALSPAEKFEFINTPGKDTYAWMVMDRDRDMWVDLELATYPLPVCVQPQALMTGRAGA